MPIERKRISLGQAAQILAIDEGHFGDLKAIEIRPTRLTKTVAAFANADGGELFIGIDEDMSTRHRRWRGFANPEAANGHIQALESLFPLGNDFEYTLLEESGSPGLVLKLEVKKTPDIKKASDGIPYVRRGAQNLPVNTPTALKQLEYVKGLSSFEDELVNAEADVITNSVPVIDFMLRIVPTAEPGPWLTKQRLLRNGKPSVAGVLLFAEEPQSLLPKRSGIKVYRYRTKDPDGTRDTLAFDPMTVEAHAYDQIHVAVQVTTKIVEEIPRLGDEEMEAITYPSEALHEIITNAVLHRDYSIADDSAPRMRERRTPKM